MPYRAGVAKSPFCAASLTSIHVVVDRQKNVNRRTDDFSAVYSRDDFINPRDRK